MKVGVLLLNQLDVYVSAVGSLPRRPYWDKEFLIKLCTGQRCIASSNTAQTLPPSLIKAMATGMVRTPHDNQSIDYDVNLGVATLGTHPPDLLFIVRGNCRMGGKVFRLDKYTQIFEDEKGLELWISKV